MITKAPRGTKDILPDQVSSWRYIEEKILEICRAYGFQEIRTPMFEHTELFLRGIGDTTDVVEKEMYTFTDRGGRSITLRPENTASAVRAYLENKLYAENSLQKLFYIGSMFRYDRPQKGRLREFHQFGVEALGEQSPAVDAEMILLAVNFLKSLGLQDLELHLNSVGCETCRKIYREKLKTFLQEKFDQLCEDCQSRFERNPLRILDCKNCQHLLEGVPKITDCLCDECAEHFEAVQNYLRSANVPFVLDEKLVRGLDYYTKTAFEIKYLALAAQSALAGGGRYDGLVEEIGGPKTPAVGFAVGLERVLLALETQNLLPKQENSCDVFFIALGKKETEIALQMVTEFRKKNFVALMDYSSKSLKSQMKQANKNNAKKVLILGEDELARHEIILKDMATSEQKILPLDVEIILKNL